MMKRLFAALLVFVLSILPMGAYAALKKPYATEPTSEIWKTYDPSLHFYYNQLTDAEKRLFSARYDAIALGDATLWCYELSSVNAFSRARVDFTLINDCPELMFYDVDLSGYGVLQAPSDEYLSENPERLRLLNSECSSALRRIVHDGMTELEKELAIDDYIKATCNYVSVPDEGKSGDSLFTAHACLVDGKALCMGYTMGAEYALRMAGIECAAVLGNVKNFSGHIAGHSWNLVRINNSWYQCDFTWDDRGDEDYLKDFYPYMNLNTVEIRSSRSEYPVRAQLDFTHPQCMDKKDNYYVINNRILDANWQAELYLLINEQNAAGMRAAGVRFVNAELYDDFEANCQTGTLYPFTDLPLAFTVLTDERIQFAYFTW